MKKPLFLSLILTAALLPGAALAFAQGVGKAPSADDTLVIGGDVSIDCGEAFRYAPLLEYDLPQVAAFIQYQAVDLAGTPVSPSRIDNELEQLANQVELCRANGFAPPS